MSFNDAMKQSPIQDSASFTKENMELYFRELAKEYRKLAGKYMPAEIVLIGGAAVVAGYGFRDMTTDIDAVIRAGSAMKEAINRVGDRYHLPNGWLNADFQSTPSYSSRLAEYSSYLYTRSNVLEVRTVQAEYLVAMKLVSGRRYKRDLSDIIGILSAHRERGDPIDFRRIDKAMVDLYGSWDLVDDFAKSFLQIVLETKDLKTLYGHVTEKENAARNAVLEVDHEYPNVINENNINSIIEQAEKKLEESGRHPSL